MCVAHACILPFECKVITSEVAFVMSRLSATLFVLLYCFSKAAMKTFNS